MLVFLFFTAVYAALSPEEQFQQFITKYSKQYENKQEFDRRFKIFSQSLKRIEKNNAEHVQVYNGEAIYGVTKFSDMTPAEFKTMYLTAKPNNIPDEKRIVPQFNGPLADSIDWVKKGACTPVKDQGMCGSCWAFSAVEAIESYGKLSGHYPLQVLSTQQVTSCDHVGEDAGCKGGFTETAYQYVVKNGGITSEKKYPYKSGKTWKTGICYGKKAKDVVEKITGFVSVKFGEDNLLKAVNEGPVSICIAADSLMDYNRGIVKKCPGEVDHCVQVSGYGVSGGEKYWTVKNSWATDWGEKGFVRILQGQNLCNISGDATYPTFGNSTIA